MKNFKLFMIAIDEEVTEEAIVVIFWSIVALLLYLCSISEVMLTILIIICLTYISIEAIVSFSKWSKKVMKKYKQLKGENNEKI